MRPALEFIDDVGEARAPLREVRRIDLRDVPHADDLRAGAGSRDKSLHLLRRQVLRLIDNEEAVEERAAAHEAHRLHADPGADDVLRRVVPPGAGGGIGVVQHFEVIFQSPHPGHHLLFFCAGEETDLFTYRDRRAGEDDFRVPAFIKRLRESRGKREERFAGAGLTEERYEVNLVVHEEVQREVLFAVPRGDAPDVILRGRVILE